MMKNILAVFLTLSIPFFLIIGVWQSSTYSKLENALQDYDREQYRLIEENKRKISGVAILLRNERIERIAVQTFNMRKASSDEILRVELEKEFKNED